MREMGWGISPLVLIWISPALNLSPEDTYTQSAIWGGSRVLTATVFFSSQGILVGSVMVLSGGGGSE